MAANADDASAWTTHYDEASGAYYHSNAETGETRWDDGAADAHDTAAAQHDDAAPYRRSDAGPYRRPSADASSAFAGLGAPSGGPTAPRQQALSYDDSDSSSSDDGPPPPALLTPTPRVAAGVSFDDDDDLDDLDEGAGLVLESRRERAFYDDTHVRARPARPAHPPPRSPPHRTW